MRRYDSISGRRQSKSRAVESSSPSVERTLTKAAGGEERTNGVTMMHGPVGGVAPCESSSLMDQTGVDC